jgi:hypothetical protein
VQDDLELAGPGVEALLEPRARELELREHALGVLAVALVVARHERLGGGIDPSHDLSVACGGGVSKRSSPCGEVHLASLDGDGARRQA